MGTRRTRREDTPARGTVERLRERRGRFETREWSGAVPTTPLSGGGSSLSTCPRVFAARRDAAAVGPSGVDRDAAARRLGVARRPAHRAGSARFGLPWPRELEKMVGEA